MRTARFRCVLCLIDSDGYITHYDGSCEGRMDTKACGGEGFGYDPAFIPELCAELWRTRGGREEPAQPPRTRSAIVARGRGWARLVLNALGLF